MSCARCASPLEDGDLRCPICALAPAEEPGTEPVPRARVLRCHECNAAVAFVPSAGAPRCVFCTATMAIEQPSDPVEQPAAFAPFAVDREAASAALRGWLATRGWLAPAVLRDEATLESIAPLHWPAWLVDARAHVAWTADSDAGALRSRWAPHAGAVELAFDGLAIPASRGLTARECARLIPYYRLDAMTERAAAGATVEAYEAQRSAARAIVQRAITSAARTRVERVVPGTRFRNVNVSCLVVGQTTRRVALPVWVLAYRFRGRSYRALVHGQRRDLVLGGVPLDGWKLARVAAVVAIAIAVVVALVGCGSRAELTPDAEDFFDRCTPSGPFAPLTGRAAVQGTLNVHVDAGGLIEADTTSKLLLALDIVQAGTELAIAPTLCRVEIPNIPLAGQELPLAFEVPDATIASVPTVMGTATLASADESCAALASRPVTVVIGARLDPAAVATAPLPAVNEAGTSFPACAPTAATTCADASGTSCACDQEGDGEPGLTLLAHNVPAIELDRVFVTLRTTFALEGRVHTADLVKGRVDAALDIGVLGCKLAGGAPCTEQNVRLVQTLSPVVTQQPANPSTFRSVRIPDAMTCAEIIASEGMLFPR